MARLLARTAAVVVPLGGDPERRLVRAQAFLSPLPWWLRGLFGVTLLAVWALATLARRGQPSRDAAVARWVETFMASRVHAAHLLGQLVKFASCLVVLGDPQVRRSLYAARRLTLPSQVESVRAPLLAGRPLNGSRVTDSADFIVVGSGPAGATVARTLAKAGRDVVLLEEGPAAPAAWAAQDTIENLHARFRGMGTVTSTGPERIPVLQGCCVGGSSVVNSAIAWRAPEGVFGAWHADPGIAEHLPLARLDRAYTEVEAGIGIETTREAVFGATNERMAAGARAKGTPGQPTDRYTRDCEGLGRCMEGCPLGRKLSMNATFVPEAVAAGARLYSDCKVEQIEFEGTRVVGVRARTSRGVTRFAARRAVVVAASAVQTPILLRASGIDHAQLGRRFQAHPGGSMAALFAEPVRKVLGATQGYEV
ncbi:MAG: GMC family oxidoreductase N-terminal domain-containing protein, partial [Deltaproteobacteria bacterium]|nr:GMC family oxidoreductase N-terminal domain-containing protein [Deltaproteobacteria bacterium]